MPNVKSRRRRNEIVVYKVTVHLPTGMTATEGREFIREAIREHALTSVTSSDTLSPWRKVTDDHISISIFERNIRYVSGE